MGAFDFKGQFPTSALIDAAIKRRQLEEQEKARRQEQMLQTLQTAGQAGANLNKYQMNKQMAQTLAGSPAVQDYLGHTPDPVVAKTPAAAPMGQPINFSQTAQGGVGVLPKPNLPKKLDPRLIQPFVDAGKGDDLLKQAQDMDYRKSTVTDMIPIKDASGNITGYQQVTRDRGARTLAPSGPQKPPTPRAGPKGPTHAQLMNTAVDNASGRLKSEFPFGQEQAKAAGLDYNKIRQEYIKEEFTRLQSESTGGNGSVPQSERDKFISGAIGKGYSPAEAEQLAKKAGL